MSGKRTNGVVAVVVVSACMAIVMSPWTVAEQTEQTEQASTQASEAQDKPFPDFDEVIEGMEEVPGLMTLYRADPDDKSRDHTKLLCVIPSGLLDQDLLFATSVSRGRLAGFMWQDHLVRWRVVGKHVKLVVPESRYVEEAGEPVTAAIERTYRPRYLAALPIVTMRGQDVVVDLGPLLLSRVANPPAVGGSVNRELSQYTKIKNFPENLLIDVDLAMGGPQGGGQSVGISYGFRKLPPLADYQPREADDRVGYFTTVRQDWTRRHSDRETAVRYVNRWKLEKRDPELRLSPPTEPIVFIIEKTVPIRWRRFVRAGIAEWNKAFEQIGYVDAIVVQQQTETNEFADYDPEDARYNFIRWIVSGGAFAMGPSRADPRTGQILDADIIIDDAMLRWFTRQFDVLGPQAMASVAGPGHLEYLRENPNAWPPHADPRRVAAELGLAGGSRPPASPPAASPHETPGHEEPTFLGPGDARAGVGPGRGAYGDAVDHDHLRHADGCHLAVGLQHELALAHFAMARAMIDTPTGKQVPDELIGRVIQQVITHEVGHTLGLRHNFKASSWLSIDKIQARRARGDEPTSASVMDYNPMIFMPGDKLDATAAFISPTLGPYDYWAIEYGYRVPGEDDGDEEQMLARIAARSAEPGHAYATDEDTYSIYSPDPYANRWDYTDDPLAWSRSRMTLVDELMQDVTEWAVEEDDPRHYLRLVVETLMWERARHTYFTARLVGGQQFSRSRPSDPGAPPPLTLLDPDVQRAALAYLGETIFSADFVQLEPELLNQLPPSRWNDWLSRPSLRIDFPVHPLILTLQSGTLSNLLAPQVVQRVYDAELKTDAEDRFTAAELFETTRSMIWSELDGSSTDGYSNAQPMIRSVRRNLQSQYVEQMLTYVNPPRYLSAGASPDVQQMARHALRELSEKIEATLGSRGAGIDFASRAHLAETKSKIDRALEAQYSADGAMPPWYY